MITKRRIYLAIIIFAVSYLALAFLAHFYQPFFFDQEVTKSLQSLRSTNLDWVMRDASWPGYYPQFLAMTELILAGLLLLSLRKETITLIVTLIGSGAIGSLSKWLVNRHRPSDSYFFVNDHLENGLFSFPAGHVYSEVVLFGMVALFAYKILPTGSLFKKIILASVAIFLILVGIARVYLGDHWFSDVVGGYLLGSFWIMIGYLLYDYFNKKLI